jgi:hypothetical protein
LGLLLLVLAGLLGMGIQDHPLGIDELWRRQLGGQNLDGKTVLLRGEPIFDPHSDFRFNALYLVDAGTSEVFREPEFAFWFGIRIESFSCAEGAGQLTCGPFDPRPAQALEFRGTLHVEQVGKKAILWLSDVDFAEARQLIGGRWQPLPFGEFTVP